MSYIESLANNKFDGDVEKAREWLRNNGRLGGKTGVKHLAKVTRQTLRKYQKKGAATKAEQRRKDNLSLDEQVLEEYLDEEGNVVD